MFCINEKRPAADKQKYHKNFHLATHYLLLHLESFSFVAENKMSPHVTLCDEPTLKRYQNMLTKSTPSFLHGACYVLAIALNRELGWPMVAPKKKNFLVFNRWTHRTGPWHVALRRPDGLLHDARGAYPEEQFGVPFGRKICPLVEITEKELLGKRLAPNHMIAEARRVAEVCWPDLPWPHSIAARATRFQTELTALSWFDYE